jgi:nicotinamidase-related amidase
MRKLIVAAFTALMLAGPASAQTIVDEWANVKAPPAPELKSVTLDPKTTAFLALDFVNQTCNQERRPRCIASIPKMAKALEAARAKGVTVIHSRVRNSKPEDVKDGLAPKGNEPTVIAPADKFIGTDLEKMLKDKGIQTVIVTGTAAHGAVLYTASEAVYHGFKAVVPVDGMSSESLYMEQYVAFQLLNLPGGGPGAVTLTRLDMIAY